MSEPFIFKLAQYAQREALAELQANKDILRTVNVEVRFQTDNAHELELKAYYSYDIDNTLHEIVDDKHEHWKLRHMPLLKKVSTREEVIDAIQQLAGSVSVARVLLAKHNAALNAAKDGDSND